MIIRVPQENVIPLLKNSEKDGLFVKQTQRANQGLMQTRPEGAGADENYVIWMPVENMLMEAQRASADVPKFMGLARRLQWEIRRGARVGPAGLEEARRRFHNQDERIDDTNRGVPVRTTWAIGPIPYSTTPLQLSGALWNWSGEVGPPPGS